MAGNGLYVRELYAALAEAIQAAWANGGQIPISPEKPREKDAPPCASIEFGDDVEIDWSGGNMAQTYKVEITGRFAWPADSASLIRFEQADRASELMAQLQTGQSFASVFYLPYVPMVSFAQTDDPQNGAYDVTVEFSCTCEVDHH